MAGKFPSSFVPNIEGASYHPKWESANKNGDAPKWRTFRDAVLAYSKGDPSVAVPVMATKYGKALVAAGEDYMSVLDLGASYPPVEEPPPPGGIPPLPASWDTPIVITAGGTYEGAWESTSFNPAIVIQTSQPVTISGYVRKLQGGGTIIDANPGGQVNVTIEDLYAYGPVAWQESPRFFWSENHKSLVFQNCTMVNTSGIEISYGAAASGLTLTRCRHTNIKGNATGGTVTKLGNFIQFRQTQTCDIQISWNEVVNEHNQSMPEDLISLYHASNAHIFDNMFWHQSALNNTSGSSQSGITIDASGGLAAGPACSNNTIERNQVVDGMGIYAAVQGGGNNNQLLDNRVVSNGYLPDGVTPVNNGYSGIDIPIGGTNNHAHGNIVGYMGRAQTPPGAPVRRDYSTLAGCPEGEVAEAANNTFMPGPITAQTEADEWTFWLAKLAANSIRVGA